MGSPKPIHFRAIAARRWVLGLTPGRYVGATDVEEDDTPFPVRFARLEATLEEQFAESDALKAIIREKLAGVVVDG